jgi:hypothetical protein
MGQRQSRLRQVRTASPLQFAYGADTLLRRYCTSDLWSGDAPASEATFNFSFRGSRVPVAVVQSLMQTHGLGGAPGSRLLFGGCSAGAIGAMNNLERVAALVASKGVQTWGFLDGAGLLDIKPRGWTWSPLLETLQSLMANMTAFTQPVFQSYCATSFPGEEYKCLLGALRFRLLAQLHAAHAACAGQYRMPLLTGIKFFVNVPRACP